MSLRRSLRVPVLLIAATAALLVFASGASAAETWTGESTTVSFQKGALTPEITLVKASASYEPTEGKLRFDAVTGAAPQPELEGKPNLSKLGALFLKIGGTCNLHTIEEVQANPVLLFGSPLALIESHFSEPTTGKGFTGSPLVEIPIQKTVSGATTTFTTSAAALANQGFNCVVAGVEGPEMGKVGTDIIFPIAPPPPPPQPAPAPAAPAPPAPPALSIASPKPSVLTNGKWKTVKVKVTNTGGTATGKGSLRVKAPKGVTVKPETQQLPALAPGASSTVSVRVQLTATAKTRSTLTVTASASGVTGTGSLVLKLKA